MQTLSSGTTRLAEAGGNFVRSWWCYGSTDLESLVSGHPDQGLGRYKQPDAWRLDRLVELAERLDIRMMCCLETQQNLRRTSRGTVQLQRRDRRPGGHAQGLLRQR